jgi:hypothetical protein
MRVGNVLTSYRADLRKPVHQPRRLPLPAPRQGVCVLTAKTRAPEKSPLPLRAKEKEGEALDMPDKGIPN